MLPLFENVFALLALTLSEFAIPPSVRLSVVDDPGLGVAATFVAAESGFPFASSSVNESVYEPGASESGTVHVVLLPEPEQSGFDVVSAMGDSCVPFAVHASCDVDGEM